jgi:hypothetical protein
LTRGKRLPAARHACAYRVLLLALGGFLFSSSSRDHLPYSEDEPGRRPAALVARSRALSLTASICCGVNQLLPNITPPRSIFF